MIRFRTPFLLFILLALFTLPGIAAETGDVFPTTIQDRYHKSKFFYKQLETNPKLGDQRQMWLKSTSNFRKVYLANPKSELAPASLFMLGKNYRRMYEKFGRKSDLHEAIGYYRDCASLFPHHRLADDSLYLLGILFNDILDEPQTAARYFSDVVSRYPQGDMHPQAATSLKTLSSKYDIALPKIMISGSNHKKLTNVLPVKYWSSNDYSRVIIKASGPVTYSAQLLEKKTNTARRLHIDFQNSYIEPRYRTPIPIADGLLNRIRTGQYTQEIVRVVLDLETISSYKIFSLPDPFRVVVDIRGKERQEVQPEGSKPLKALHKPSVKNGQIIVLRAQKKHRAAGLPSPPMGEESDLDNSPQLSLAQQLGLGVAKIVIDPGHGGRDPGAIANNLKEKDIVLKLAKKLKYSLERSLDCEVVLTRDSDRYISLEERTAIANGNNADLFLSLHVNAHPRPTVSGLETYFLNLSSNPEAMRVAAFENATSELQMSDLQDVLSDIMKNSKIEESSRLAHNVHSTLISGLDESGLTLKDLGIKQAPFYVLIGAEMPAILIEIAFISNADEARKLTDDAFLNSSAASIVRGVQSYIDSNSARLSF
ncbi:MAG TPA: N-acetylmuramoyl-L-alanine amidase [Desulfopila sp.]|nr:N-acetylmuramoyl-L-alanine amidase [Desulfopila sp.]